MSEIRRGAFDAMIVFFAKQEIVAMYVCMGYVGLVEIWQCASGGEPEQPRRCLIEVSLRSVIEVLQGQVEWPQRASIVTAVAPVFPGDRAQRLGPFVDCPALAFGTTSRIEVSDVR